MTPERISNVPNFAEDFLFLDQAEIESKFSNLKNIKILYVSNLILGKGYFQLAKAYLDLNQRFKNHTEIIFRRIYVYN